MHISPLAIDEPGDQDAYWFDLDAPTTIEGWVTPRADAGPMRVALYQHLVPMTVATGTAAAPAHSSSASSRPSGWDRSSAQERLPRLTDR